ncbi:uncharacterized protein Z520_05679 [Fonsecaea multimorphosa CBS 102226]|uniref:Bud22 domain-containing protein n=1 Tax=Fonsecaea multimorphosa CBS 102226 TaxID=1442371 RepID=A0A0D2KNX6_9EURO|nr:uncharacterized protein Z520_05679 [Fonsecaea multimorphosa CBS 102226]KIX98378.1 hypothetical protein Z520_05679 [Fonsecaea multimorphosa CBS 102226]OAL24571.1 hypothetical protein AYO22_05360 [Fonsecaea multimorphosa]
MLKRKRDDHDSEEPEKERQYLGLKVSGLRARVTRSVKTLHDALKLARGFERQKLGRRQKNASDNPQTLLRLREEVVVLKQLQLEQTAKNQLLKHLVKTKRIKEHPVFIKAYGSDPELEHVKSSAEANVIGRLFNSNPVKQALPEIMKTIYTALEIPQATQPASKETKQASEKVANSRANSGDEDEFEGFPTDGSEDLGSGRLKQSPGPELEDDDIFELANGRLASPEGESEEESDEEGAEDRMLLRQKGAKRAVDTSRYARDEDLSISPSPSEVSELDGEISQMPHSNTATSKTAFLPSLSMAGYYSGSESEDDANGYRGPAQPKPRKNRRGQRARQQIAERKFGKNAKHLEKQKDQDGRNTGWDPKRGAVGRVDRPGDRFHERKVNQKPTGGVHAVAHSAHPPKTRLNVRDDQGPLHPSWEAAKRRKMQDQGPATFQGKRITFD